MSKLVRFGKESRDLILKGMDTLADAVSVTLGPKGRNVIIEKDFGSPLITNDGVTIASEIELEDAFENMGAKLLYEVANKTNDMAGDGTTTATVLAQNMIHEGIKALDRGANPVLMRQGIEQASQAISEHLLSQSIAIESYEDIANVARISSGSDSIGKIIAEAMEKVGKDGVITVDESNNFDTELEVVEGMQFDKGYASPYMVSDREKMLTEMSEPLILVTDHKLSNIQDILPLLEEIVEANRPIYIVAEDIEEELLATLVVNKLRGTFNIAVSKAPSFGEDQKNMLEDIAILTGANFISKDRGQELSEVTISDLGSANKVVITKDSTTIIDGSGDALAIEERVAMLREQIKHEESEFNREKVETRLAKLSGGVAIIKVGAATEVELKEKKLRIEDALNATRAAVSEGVVLGGGYALADAYRELHQKVLSDIPDVQRGITLVFESILKPLWQISENAGFDGEQIVNRQLKEDKLIGFNALEGKWMSLQKEGIIDPTKVTRNALVNSASIASLFLTTEASVVKKKKESNAMPMMPEGMY